MMILELPAEPNCHRMVRVPERARLAGFLLSGPNLDPKFPGADNVSEKPAVLLFIAERPEYRPGNHIHKLKKVVGMRRLHLDLFDQLPVSIINFPSQV